MCPNCTRGLTEKKEVCDVCGGTGLVADVKVAKPKEEKVEKKGRLK